MTMRIVDRFAGVIFALGLATDRILQLLLEGILGREGMQQLINRGFFDHSWWYLILLGAVTTTLFFKVKRRMMIELQKANIELNTSFRLEKAPPLQRGHGPSSGKKGERS